MVAGGDGQHGDPLGRVTALREGCSAFTSFLEPRTCTCRYPKMKMISLNTPSFAIERAAGLAQITLFLTTESYLFNVIHPVIHTSCTKPPQPDRVDFSFLTVCTSINRATLLFSWLTTPRLHVLAGHNHAELGPQVSPNEAQLCTQSQGSHHQSKHSRDLRADKQLCWEKAAMDGWLRNSNGNSKRGRKLILLPISSYLGNIYRCCSSVLKANTLVDFNAVVAAFYSTCTRGKRKSPGLYVLKLKMHIFPLVWKAKKELSNHIDISKAEQFHLYC